MLSLGQEQRAQCGKPGSDQPHQLRFRKRNRAVVGGLGGLPLKEGANDIQSQMGKGQPDGLGALPEMYKASTLQKVGQ